MNDKYILFFFSILIFLSYFFNIRYIDAKSNNIEPLFLECIGMIFILISIIQYIENNEEKDYYKSDKDIYDYDSENPNALIKGKNISGTVYSSYPNNTPGLGWIL
jgi:hypothetical protein